MKPFKFKTHIEVIKALGKPKALHEFLSITHNISYNGIRSWREDNNIPSHYFNRIKEYAEQKGLQITIEDLLATAKPRKVWTRKNHAVENQAAV